MTSPSLIVEFNKNNNKFLTRVLKFGGLYFISVVAFMIFSPLKRDCLWYFKFVVEVVAEIADICIFSHKCYIYKVVTTMVTRLLNDCTYCARSGSLIWGLEKAVRLFMASLHI